MNVEKYFAGLRHSSHPRNRKKDANICKDALEREKGKKAESVYWFGVSHDFCYFLKCSNLFNYHNILCVYFFLSSSRFSNIYLSVFLKFYTEK